MKLKYLKLSFFDAFVLLVLCSLALVFFFFFYRKSEYIEITVKVTSQDILFAHARPSFYYSEHFTVGDVELDNLGRAISEITHVEYFPAYKDSNIVYVTLRVKATYDTRTKQYSSRGQRLVYGAPIRFSLSNVTFDGYVVDFPGKATSSEVKDVMVRVESKIRSVEPKFAELVSIGDSVKNSSGESLIEITEKSVTQAEMVTTDLYGLTYLRSNPLGKDMDLTFHISAKKIGNIYYLFDEIPLVIGSYNNFVINNNLFEGVYIFSVEEI